MRDVIRVDARAQDDRRLQTLGAFATGILAETAFVVAVMALCGVAVMAVILAGG